MKKILLFSMFVIISFTCFSQDIISLKNGNRIEVTITEVTKNLVRYKMFSDKKGKTYFVYKDEISGIMYKDGRVESYNYSDEKQIESVQKESAQKENIDPQPSTSERIQEKKETPLQSFNVSSDNLIDVIYLKNGRVIRGKILEQIPNQSVKIETVEGGEFVYYADNIEKITKESSLKKSKSQSVNLDFKPAYFGIVDVGYFYGYGNNIIEGIISCPKHRVNVNFINGYKVNQYYSLGIGVGINYYFNAVTEFFSDNNSILVPVFFAFRAKFSNNKISPYLSFDVGYSFEAKDNFKPFGVLLSPTIGASYKISNRLDLLAGISYLMQRYSYTYTDVISGYELTLSKNISFDAVGLKIGVAF